MGVHRIEFVAVEIRELRCVPQVQDLRMSTHLNFQNVDASLRFKVETGRVESMRSMPNRCRSSGCINQCSNRSSSAEQ